MQTEFDLNSNQVWLIKSLTDGMKPLKEKWHFGIKYNNDCSFKKCTFRSEGLLQCEEIFYFTEEQDFVENYSPSRPSTIFCKNLSDFTSKILEGNAGILEDLGRKCLVLLYFARNV